MLPAVSRHDSMVREDLFDLAGHSLASGRPVYLFVDRDPWGLGGSSCEVVLAGFALFSVVDQLVLALFVPFGMILTGFGFFRHGAPPSPTDTWAGSHLPPSRPMRFPASPAQTRGLRCPEQSSSFPHRCGPWHC